MPVDRSMFAEGDPGRLSFRKSNQAYLLASVGAVLWVLSGSYWPADGLGNSAAFSLGIVMVAIGFAGRLWVSTYQAGYKNKVLITVGPYSLCRNPMYFSNFLGGVGACLTTGTITIPVLFALAYAIHYQRVIPDEEARLRRHHGAAFDAYHAVTPLIVPSLKGFSQPDEYLVRTRELSTRIPLALWPIVAVVLIHFVAALHRHDLLPVLFRIY